MRIRRVPLRLVTGAFILNSCLSKREVDAETAERLHGFATTAYPDLKRFRPEQFAQLLSTAEIALPDPVAYRRDWTQYRIRLTFGTPPGGVETSEIAAPEPSAPPPG